MEISIDRVNTHVHLRARNEDGNEVHIDGSSAIGGEGAGYRPMQLVLAALAGCASMDLVPILAKQRLDEKKARQAIELALYKYCSVGEMLKQTVDNTYTFTVTRSNA